MENFIHVADRDLHSDIVKTYYEIARLPKPVAAVREITVEMEKVVDEQGNVVESTEKVVDDHVIVDPNNERAKEKMKRIQDKLNDFKVTKCGKVKVWKHWKRPKKHFLGRQGLGSQSRSLHG